MRDTDWVVRIGDEDYRAPDLETVKEWARWGRVPASAFIFDPQSRSWRPAREVAPVAEIPNQPVRPIAADARAERGKSASGCQIAALLVLGIIVVGIVMRSLIDASSSGVRRSTAKSTTDTSSLADSGWRPAAGHLWTGIMVYHRASKTPAFEILGGNENYLAPDGRRIRAVKVRYPTGSVEWRDRSWLINSGEFVVRADDPALARKSWYVYEY